MPVQHCAEHKIWYYALVIEKKWHFRVFFHFIYLGWGVGVDRGVY